MERGRDGGIVERKIGRKKGETARLCMNEWL